MRIACPACGKNNDDGSGSACTRCGCDLSRLRAVSRCAGRRLAQAAARIRAGDWLGALSRAEESWRLQRSPGAAQVAFLAAAAYGATGKAAVWLRRARGGA